MKKRRYRLMKPVIVGFAAVYLAIMLLSTYLVKIKFEDDYEKTLKETLLNIQRNIYEQETAPPDTWDDAAKHVWYQSVANSLEGGLWPTEEFMQLSLAVYDEKGELLAKTENVIGTWRTSIDTLLSQEDKETLAEYEAVNYDRDRHNEPCPYAIHVREGDKIYQIFVREDTWEEKSMSEGGHYHTAVTTPYTDYFGNDYYPDESDTDVKYWDVVDTRLIWDRTIEEPDSQFPPRIESTSVYFPYIQQGYNNWEKWDKSEYLHNFPEKTDLSKWSYDAPAKGGNAWLFRKIFTVRLLAASEGSFTRYIEARMESYPWLAAINYMKYVYGAGFAIILACMAKIIYSANKLYNQQEALEETRRDFINAIAHELKTPLGIIRNFSENLLEHNMEEKREYYLEQIIGQTEEMDGMAREMILASQMDSEKLVLQKETVSMAELIDKQLLRLKPMLDEKQIQVEIQKKQDFGLEGDPDYLAKAVGNLLSNAVDYNVAEGRILITLEEGSLSIENTSEPLNEEQLKHSFELFYNQNKSRSNREGKHMGLGLYLAKRIFEMHGLEITLDNTEMGVQVRVFFDPRAKRVNRR